MNNKDKPNRQRVTLACDVCRKRKTRCDGVRPSCSICQSDSITCTYKDKMKRRGPQKGYTEALEQRLLKMEYALGELFRYDPKLEEFVERGAKTQSCSTDDKSTILKSKLAQSTSNSMQGNKVDPWILDDEGQMSHYENSSDQCLFRSSSELHNNMMEASTNVNAVTKNTYTRSLLEILPDPQLFSRLVDIYFTSINPIFTLLHKAEFLVRLNQNEKEKPYFLLNAMFSLSSAMASLNSTWRLENLDAEVYFRRSRTLLSQVWDKSTMENAQGLVLLSIYSHLIQDFKKSWIYSGIAIRMVEDLGLHRDPNIWNSKLTPNEMESRKRVWWVCYIIDRFSSVCVGRPVSIYYQQFDTPLPRLDEEDISSLNQVSLHSGMSLRVFVEVIKLHELIGHVWSTIHIARATQKLNKIHYALIMWLDSLPLGLAYVPAEYFAGNLPKNPAIIYAHVWYHSALILLHRPFISKPESFTSMQASSSQICIDAANSITAIISACKDHPDFSHIILLLLFPTYAASAIHFLQATSHKVDIKTSQRTKLFKNVKILKQIHQQHGYAKNYYKNLMKTIEASSTCFETGDQNRSPAVTLEDILEFQSFTQSFVEAALDQ
ncbi:hypothetical protein K7432_007662 [Basidiobolus ranarum]|uniref:Zn(2)-C6 fungal-type domain-containing protein n=1 Tax=Basidiobolus ranarum TaxID=34480 RepID=A0ABR2VZS8_9FUNG